MKAITPELLRALPLPRHEQGDSKEGRGQILLVGGCLALPGAILLSAEGAMRAGAGKLQIATCRSIAVVLGVAIPEAMVIGLPESGGHIAPDAGRELGDAAAHADAVLIGPGMMNSQNAEPLVADLLGAAGAQTGFVLDAGALDGLEACREQLHRAERSAIITPHAGEMAKLLGVSRDLVSAEPLQHATEAARRFNCTVVLKGGTTHIVQPDGEAWEFKGGTIGLGTSGSGDVLAGIIAGLLARGADPSCAAIWGVYLHGEAGSLLTRDHGGIGLLARELAAELPAIMAGVTEPER